MRFPPAVLAAIADGRVDRAFRRWQRPLARPGASQRTAIGVIAFDAVEPMVREEVAEADAHWAGFASRQELLAFLDRRPDGAIYRVRLRLVGPDPRVALRDSLPDEPEVALIELRLACLDRFSRHGQWTREVLEAIGSQPGVRAADLAPQFARERLPFKADVRKLKELGLTESLEVGYRLSPRGRAVLDHLATQAPPKHSGRCASPGQRGGVAG
jgi:hypothetical protein